MDRGGENVYPLVLGGLEDPDATVVRNAAVALAFFEFVDGRGELLSGLADPDEFRRWEAVFSLRDLGNDEVVQALIGLLDEAVEPATRVRSEAVLSLGRIGGPGVTEPLLRTLRGDSSSQVRWRAALALSRDGDPAALPGLQDALLGERDEEVLGHIQDAIDALTGG